MSPISRRSVLGTVAVGVAGAAAAYTVGTISSADPEPAPRWRESPIAGENRLRGSGDWQVGMDGTTGANDVQMQIKGYASATSVNVGGFIDFYVTVQPEADFSVAICRLGHYSGLGARHIITSLTLHGVTQPAPELDDATGMISCIWPSAWRLEVPKDWTSGYYLAVFTTDSEWRSFTPFVVRDDNRSADLCVIIPFSTYQAYNLWPSDGRRGKSLYYGYDSSPITGGNLAKPANLAYERRAFKVSFDRPYGNYGLPNRFDLDHEFVHWVETRGYDVTYASNIDLHTGQVDLSKYAGVVFSGHDEYWSREMRDTVTRAVAQGTSLAFMTANNVYWHVRIQPSTDISRADRAIVCYKTDTDPAPGRAGATRRWRDGPPGPDEPEQGLLGVQYNGILPAPIPLVVQSAEHWFWAGTGVKNGDRIDKIIGGEADGIDERLPGPKGVKQTILSASPYRPKNGPERIQNTSVYETEQGAIVFAAGSLTWPYGLSREGFKDARIQRATANVLNRIVRRT